MKFRSMAALAAIAAVGTFTACDDTASNIGASLTGQNVEIIIDSAYTVHGKPVPVPYVSPRITDQIIGRVDIPGYGTLSSDVVAQFLPSTELDTAQFTAANVDSISILLQYNRGAFLGDSVAPMGLTVYPLDKQLPSDLNSAFNPEGYYSETPLATKIYNTSTFYGTATEQAATTRTIRVKLPLSLGRDLFNKCVENPSSYADGKVFARDVFPGIYMANSFGNGRLTTLSICGMTMNLRKIYTPEGEEEPDTIDAEHLYYLVTPEVINNNNITYKMDEGLKAKIAEGRNIVTAPAGSEVEFTFPTQEIISKYKASTANLAVINGLSLEIPVDTIENGFGVAPPPYLLLVLKKDRDEFFAKNKLADNVTSFYASYSSANRKYSFLSLRSYITEMLSREEITADDYTFSLVPVQVTFESTANSGYYGTTSQVESEIYPYVAGPAMAELLLDEAKIKFTYSLQTQK